MKQNRIKWYYTSTAYHTHPTTVDNLILIMNISARLSSRRRAKLVKRRTNQATPSPLLLPPPLYTPHAEPAPEVRYASVPLRSPCPISPVRPKFTAIGAPTILATRALYTAITQEVGATEYECQKAMSSDQQQVTVRPVSIV